MEKIKDTKRCKTCGTPIFLKKEYQWRSNGTFGPGQTHHNYFIKYEEFNNLFYSIEERFGVSIGKIVAEAEKESAARYVDEILSGLKGKIIRNGFLMRMALNRVTKSARILGDGDIQITELIYKKRMKATFKNVFYPPFMAGELAGAFQSMCRVPTNVKWEKIEEEIIATAWALEKEPELAKYVASSVKSILPGDIIYERCQGCGVPKQITDNFEWNLQAGIITNKKTGERWLISATISLGMIFGALERELGKEIPRIIMEIEKEYTKKIFLSQGLKGTEKDYRSLFDPKDFGIKGWGNPIEVTKKGKNLRVHIDNPFNEILLAGRIAGMYEVIEKTEAKVQWTPSTEGYTIVTVTVKN